MSDTEARELERQVFKTMAVLEQFEQLLARFEAFLQTIEDKGIKAELDVHVSTLKSLVNVLDTDGVPLDGTEGAMGGYPYRTIIERLGISGELLRARGQSGMTLKKLSEMYGVGKETLSRFFRAYDEAKPKERIRMQRISVFDTGQQLEDLCVTIKRNMARLEGANDDVNVKMIAEMRQTIQLAATFAEKMANAQRYQQFTSVVYEVLSSELPHRRTEILKKIQAAGMTPSTSVLLEAEVKSALPVE